jgi:hypothetical protein
MYAEMNTAPLAVLSQEPANKGRCPLGIGSLAFHLARARGFEQQ